MKNIEKLQEIVKEKENSPSVIKEKMNTKAVINPKPPTRSGLDMTAKVNQMYNNYIGKYKNIER